MNQSDWNDESEVYKTKLGLIGKIDRVLIAIFVGLFSICSMLLALFWSIQNYQLLLQLTLQLTYLIYLIIGLIGIILLLTIPIDLLLLIATFISSIHRVLFKDHLLPVRIMNIAIIILLIHLLWLLIEGLILFLLLSFTFNLFGACVIYAIIGLFSLILGCAEMEIED